MNSSLQTPRSFVSALWFKAAEIALVFCCGQSLDPTVAAAETWPVFTNCPGDYFRVCETNVLILPGFDYSYQWFQVANGSTNLLAGETNQCMERTSVVPPDAGTYFVRLTSNMGGQNSSSNNCEATLSVPEPIEIGPVPASPSVLFGQQLTEICPPIFGTPPFTFTWRKNGVALPGQTNACLTAPNCAGLAFGYYTLEGSNSCSTAIVRDYVVVRPSLVNYSSSAGRIDPIIGTSVEYCVHSFRQITNVIYFYQWYKSDPPFTLLADQTNQCLILSNLSMADSGYYYPIVTASLCGESITEIVYGVEVRVVPRLRIQRALANGPTELTYQLPTGADVTFSIAGATNIAGILDWKNLGVATPVSDGLYRFIDYSHTNCTQYFYRVQ